MNTVPCGGVEPRLEPRRLCLCVNLHPRLGRVVVHLRVEGNEADAAFIETAAVVSLARPVGIDCGIRRGIAEIVIARHDRTQRDCIGKER